SACGRSDRGRARPRRRATARPGRGAAPALPPARCRRRRRQGSGSRRAHSRRTTVPVDRAGPEDRSPGQWRSGEERLESSDEVGRSEPTTTAYSPSMQQTGADALTVGLVGAGPWASMFHAPAIAGGPETRLAAVWARRPEAAGELAAA